MKYLIVLCLILAPKALAQNSILEDARRKIIEQSLEIHKLQYELSIEKQRLNLARTQLKQAREVAAAQPIVMTDRTGAACPAAPACPTPIEVKPTVCPVVAVAPSAPVAPPAPVTIQAAVMPVTPKQERVSIYGGAGPDGVFNIKDNGSYVSVSPNIGVLIGLSYSRVMSGPWSISTIIARGAGGPNTSYTGLFGFGYDF